MITQEEIQRKTSEIIKYLEKTGFAIDRVDTLTGAEALVGNGDMLFSYGGKFQRIQACLYICETE